MNTLHNRPRFAAILRLWVLAALSATAAGCHAIQDYPDQLKATAESAELLGRDITGHKDPVY